MTAKFQNRIKRILYRPAKKSPARDYVESKLKEAEKALEATIGGAMNKRRRKRPAAKKQDKKD